MTLTSHKQHQCSGFTLIELMVVLTVAAVLLAVGVPSYRDFSSNNRMLSSMNRLVGTIHYAKSQAVARSERVVICKGTSAACVTTGDWTQGWAVFADENADGTLDDGELLNVQNALNPGITSFGATAGAVNSITFSGGGRTTLSGPQTFVMCDKRGFDNSAKAIVVTGFGTTTVHKAAETDQTACL
jgi:type IV fimbrial biogenesis protein FimT